MKSTTRTGGLKEFRHSSKKLEDTSSTKSFKEAYKKNLEKKKKQKQKELQQKKKEEELKKQNARRPSNIIIKHFYLLILSGICFFYTKVVSQGMPRFVIFMGLSTTRQKLYSTSLIILGVVLILTYIFLTMRVYEKAYLINK